jgi:iron(III) transport system substrate-binding protein
MAAALEEAFEKERGDVLTVVSGPWCRKLKSELEAGDIQADVIYGAEPIFYMGLKKSGALLPYTSPQAANRHFTLADVRYVCIVYNKNMVDVADVPTTIDGLTDPRWAGMLTVPDATQCAAAFAVVAGLVQPDLDYSFFEGAKANNALLCDRAGKLPAMVASGEAALGVGPHDPVLRLWNKAKKEGSESPVAIVWPEGGALSIPRPIAIIADENRSEAATQLAQEFVDFVLSPQGQTIAVKFGFVPVREGIELPSGVPGDLETIDIDWAWAQANKKDIQAGFESIMYGE